MNWFAGIAFATSLIVMPAVAHAESAPIDTKVEIQKIATEWMNAYNKKDAATIGQIYTDDAIFSNPGWTASGRAAIQESLGKEFAADIFKYTSITVDQSQRVGDLNYSQGTWTADMKGPDGKNLPVNGHWLIVSKCQGQKCLALIHNGNVAMPPPK